MLAADVKTALADAMLMLLRTSPLQDISVRQIVGKCGLSARAFYNHFSDKYDLMEYIYYRINEPCWFQNGKPCSFEVGYARWTQTDILSLEILRNMYSYFGQNDMREIVQKKTTSDLRRQFIWKGRADMLDDEVTSGMITLIAMGLSGMLENYAVDPAGSHKISAKALYSCIPEPQRTILFADPNAYVSAARIKSYDPLTLEWPPKYY